MSAAHNPYGTRPGGGITLPEYFRPTPSCTSNNFAPPNEPLAAGEMLICFTGSTPWPPTLIQSGTSIVLELGNGTPFPRRLFFDFGNGCVKNILQRGILPPMVRDIFISHLHVDHYADLPYFIEVVEFDYTDDNGICLQEDGLTVRHWGRSHVKNGASAFRVDWEEADLSFVWTGDGRPDETTIEFAQGVDVFVTEGQADLPQLLNYKYGTPKEVLEFTLDTYHTPYYAAGYLMNEIQPRVGMICHYTEESAGEAIAEVRAHWDGLFLFGGPDVKVVNVTKDRVWERMALRPEQASMQLPDPRDLFPPGQVPDYIQIPEPRLPREEQQDAYLRDRELDPDVYYPADVSRPLTQHYDEETFRVDVQALIAMRDESE